MTLDSERRARVALSFLVRPGDTVLGAALRTRTASEILALVTGPEAGRAALLAGPRCDGELARAAARWRDRAGQIPATARLAAWQDSGLRLVVPGDAEWPTQLDDLGDARPVVLWLRGAANLRLACVNSVSVVGTRASTSYGEHVAFELAAALAERGTGVVSGGSYGIDSAAHRGALGGDGATVAVLPGGLAAGYAHGSRPLLEQVAARGVLVSECPPASCPGRASFLVRNRITAALSRGTVVAEAPLRSGALSTARHARELCRPVMAVPGPVTSVSSAGCHELIRDYGAMLVTCAADVAVHVSLDPQAEPAGPRSGPSAPRDLLPPVSAAVLDEVPLRGGRGTASIAVAAGVDLDTAIGCLGELARDGFVQRCERGGWQAAGRR